MKILKIAGIVAAIMIAMAIIVLAYLIVGYQNTKTRKEEAPQVTNVPPLAIPDEASAIAKVRNRTEVFKFELDLQKMGKKASFEAQEDGDEWQVQVFEVVQNKGVPSHTATFGWYRVNKQTGKIEVEL